MDAAACETRRAGRACVAAGNDDAWLGRGLGAVDGDGFPDSGRYVVPRATQPVEIDRERDEGVYHDQNVWMVHDVA